MKPPANFDAPAKALWKVVERDLRERESLRDVDAAAVERYVRAEMVARLAWARVAEREKVEGAAAWRVRGSHGGWQPDPDVRTAQQASKDAQSFAADLGITPRARAAMRTAPDELDSMLADLAGGR